MIVTECYTTRSDGVRLVRTYSDKGFMIERDGIMYDEAVDPEELNRQYNETNEKIVIPELDPEEALAIITGGEK